MMYIAECDHRVDQWVGWAFGLTVGGLMLVPMLYAIWTWDAFGKPAAPPPPNWDSLLGDQLAAFRECRTLGRCTIALIQGIDWSYQVWVIWLWLRIVALPLGLVLIKFTVQDMKKTLFPVRRKRKSQ